MLSGRLQSWIKIIYFPHSLTSENNLIFLTDSQKLKKYEDRKKDTADYEGRK